MSTRSKEIASALDELDFHSARARQVAAWDTRAAKEHGVDLDALVRVWDERLSNVGYDEAEREAVLRPRRRAWARRRVRRRSSVC